MGKEHLLDYSYLGKELDLFSRAENWKKYWSSLIAPHLNGTVIDVGAGIGANVSVLLQPAVRRLVCLEPDPVLGQQLRERISQEPLAARCERWQGTIHDLTDSTAFDAILYIDVLEHIEHDAAEVAAASRLLRPGGRLIVLAPAHPFLFSPFDEAIGHYRRYTKQMMAAVVPPGLQRIRLDYLDAAGFWASLGNRLLLRTSMPTARQIAFWDKVLVPLSMWVDAATGYRFGKSVLGVWKR